MRAVKLILAVAVLSLVAAIPACSCSDNGRQGRFDLGGDGMITIGTISVTPADVTLDLDLANPTPQTQAFTVIFHGPKADSDVTALSSFSLSDPTIGSMNGNTFQTGNAHGGSATLTANYTPPAGSTLAAFANIHVKVHGTLPGNCMNCPPFPPDNAPACAASAAATIVYPPDGVLLPPNMEQIDIQYTQGTADTMFELDFANPATDIRVLAKCVAVSDTRGVAVPGGCSFPVDAMVWDYVAKSNRAGDPVTLTIRATTDGTCASPSANTVKVSFGQEDVVGGIYYWKSTVTAQGTGGEIWRKSFGDTMAEELISPSSGSGFSATCYGCHFLSRDGLRMTISADDSDSDDEYTDVSMGLVDVATKKFITMISYASGQAAGFQTFAPDHSLYLGTVGDGTGSRTAGGFGSAGMTNQFFIWNGSDGTDAVPPSVTVGTTGQRPAQPDWSNDNKFVAFVIPTLAGWPESFGGRREDDAHVYGGSIWTMPYNGNGMFGTPVEIVKSTGDNNYYPSVSPDGQLIAYNHVDHQASGATLDTCSNGFCPNDSFSNPKARVFLVAAQGVATPIDLELANGSPSAQPVDVSNSWPRWTPFVQKYKDGQLLWVTFSSTRDYGLRVRNHVQVGGMQQIQCYPPDSAENPNGSHGDQFPNNCQQPQIWMAAINLSQTETGNGGDPSFPAFWLPFQDIKTHNHAAQWTAAVVTTPPPDGGMCLSGNDDCTLSPNNCCVGICEANGRCGVP